MESPTSQAPSATVQNAAVEMPPTSEQGVQVAAVEETPPSQSTATGSPALKDQKSVATPDFPLETPMLVMPYKAFKAQSRICKSTTAWREDALSNGWLVEYVGGMVAVFISHTWWGVVG